MTVNYPQEPHTQGTGTPPDAMPTSGFADTAGAGQPGSANTQPSSQDTAQAAKDGAANVSDAAKDQAGKVADTAKSAGRNVADTAKVEVRQVTDEAKQQARQLLDQTMHEVRDQAKTQQGRAAEGMRTFSDDLHGMADDTNASLASQLVGEAAQRATSAAGWLEEREPADLLDEVKSFARRKPVTFIAIAGITGLLVGRLARGLVADAKDQSGADTAGRPSGTAGSSGMSDPFGTTPAAAGAVADTNRAAMPVDNEPWHGERPAADVPGVTGYPSARRESGL